KIKLNSPVTQVTRTKHGVSVTANGSSEIYDHVIIATHSDQALEMLNDADEKEKAILGAIGYQKNSVVLHTDERMMPRRRATWSSWNYQLPKDKNEPPVLTYAMNILQNIKSDTQFFVTLNAAAHIDPAKVLGQYEYAHPVFSRSSIKAQQQWDSINGVNRTWFCGAYWHNGFHEDGVNSGRRIAEALGINLDE
ncbi:MAG: FAD-dependent oxidoreductase, partial [Sphingobacteriales bacterium]